MTESKKEMETTMANEVTKPTGDQVPSTSTAMVLGSDAYRGALEPSNRNEAWELAQLMASEGHFGLKTPGEALAKLMYGRTLGIPAVHAFQSLHSIEGKIGADAALLHGICVKSPLCEYFEPIFDECDLTKAVFETKRVGRPKQRLTYTIEEAEAMGVLERGKDDAAKKKNNWNAHRKSMLMARCKSMLARAVYPDLTHGLYSTDELHEIGEPDPNEIVGEVVSAAEAAKSPADQVVFVQAAKRDYAGEADALIAKARAAKTRQEQGAVRQAIEAWDGVSPHRDRVVEAYNESKKAARAAAVTPPTEPSATGGAPMPEGNLFAGKEPEQP